MLIWRAIPSELPAASRWSLLFAAVQYGMNLVIMYWRGSFFFQLWVLDRKIKMQTVIVFHFSTSLNSQVSANGGFVLIEFDLSPAITRKDSSGIFNESMLPGTAGAHYSLNLTDPYVTSISSYYLMVVITRTHTMIFQEYAVAQILCQPSPVSTSSPTYSLLSVLASNPLWAHSSKQI